MRPRSLSQVGYASLLPLQLLSKHTLPVGPTPPQGHLFSLKWGMLAKQLQGNNRRRRRSKQLEGKNIRRRSWGPPRPAATFSLSSGVCLLSNCKGRTEEEEVSNCKGRTEEDGPRPAATFSLSSRVCLLSNCNGRTEEEEVNNCKGRTEEDGPRPTATFSLSSGVCLLSNCNGRTEEEEVSNCKGRTEEEEEVGAYPAPRPRSLSQVGYAC
ncbi:hypothetical protein C1H46_036103 [Malus baccata]|uniref:Uncharacterized protein n=1 Tax=Malus baccata TaxID=106549 RepID=A0A540KVV4_MALBA|nr:hypothetical protein C1H46_036103 [Malus baccata]